MNGANLGTSKESRTHGRILLEARDVTRVLSQSDNVARTTLLDTVSLEIARGEFVALTGASGSGKSTLLYLLGALDRPTSGAIVFNGVDVAALSDGERATLRNESIGFVFQFHFLLPEFTVLENVTIPALRRGKATRYEIRERAMAILEMFGLADLYRRLPSQLSGGQQQRVSVARALANDPELILADEPTGNLDSRNGEAVFEVFAQLAREQRRTVVMVTHDAGMASRTDRRILLKDGRILEANMEEVRSISGSPHRKGDAPWPASGL